LIAAQPLGPTASPTFAGLTITGLNGIAKYSSGVLGTANADVDYSVPNGVETLTNKTYDTAGAGNVFKINGTQITGVVGSGSVLLGTSTPLTGYTVSGNTTVLGTASGSFTANHCAKWDANGNLVDNGSTCSGGTGMTYPATSGIAVSNTSAWLTSLTAPSGTIVGTTDTQTLTNKNLTSGTNTFPTFNQSTSGNAATATALAASPTNCSAGQAPQGINASGTAQNCTAYTPATAGSAILAGNGSGSTSNVTIGTGLSFTGGTLSNTATQVGLGSWTSKSVGSVYQASTDGYVTFSALAYNSGAFAIRYQCLTDSSSSPSTVRLSSLASWQSGYTSDASITCPVRKNDYYEITSSTVEGSASPTTYGPYFVSSGT
jgi:hypothetical protein